MVQKKSGMWYIIERCEGDLKVLFCRIVWFFLLVKTKIVFFLEMIDQYILLS